MISEVGGAGSEAHLVKTYAIRESMCQMIPSTGSMAHGYLSQGPQNHFLEMQSKNIGPCVLPSCGASLLQALLPNYLLS